MATRNKELASALTLTLAPPRIIFDWRGALPSDRKTFIRMIEIKLEKDQFYTGRSVRIIDV